jgi:hypothetical protein
VPNPAARRRRREVQNEGIARDAAYQADGLLFVCECGRTKCAETIRISLSHYQRFRSWDSRFVLVPGHEDLDEETVIERHDGWLVVQTLEPFRPEPPDERRSSSRPWSQTERGCSRGSGRRLLSP